MKFTSALSRLLALTGMFALFATVSHARYPDEEDCAKLPDITALQNKATLVPAVLAKELTASFDGLLIGERHGSVEHITAVICFLRQIKARNISVVFEHLNDDQTPILKKFRADFPESPRGLSRVLNWEATGWPAWSVYAPLIEYVWTRRNPIVAGDVSPDISSKPPKPVREGDGSQFAAAKAQWQSAMMKAHCNLISEDRAAELAELQLLRDQNMADHLSAERAKGNFVVLLAGRSHIRKDRSVPLHLPPTMKIATLALGDEQQDFEHVTSGTYDYLWMVGKGQHPNPCARFNVPKQ